MITVYDVAVPNHLKLIHSLLLVFELVLILPGLVVVIACGYVIFFRAPQFHSHVHLIMASIFIAYLVVTATRVSIIIVFFLESTMEFEVSVTHPSTIVLDAVRSAAASAVLLSIPILTLERAVATLRIKSYERERHFFLLSCFLLFCYIGCCFNAYLIIKGVPLYAFIAFGMVWLIFNYIGFKQLVSWSQMEYDHQMKSAIQPLTVRFQLSENVRLGNILLATLQAFCFGVAMALILVILCTVVAIPYKMTSEITLGLYHLFEIEIATATASVALTIIRADKKWASELKKVCWSLVPCCKKNVFPEKKLSSVFSLAGSQLIVRQDQEATTYFDSLRNQWQ